MEWSADALVLAVRRLGESGAVVSLLTADHGRHAGLVPGGAARRAQAMLQPGNRVHARWRARLADQLGTLACELAQPLAPRVLADRRRLAAVTAACALLETALPEREPLPSLYEALMALLQTLETAPGSVVWPADYVRFEIALLADLGYGLDLGCCAVTGATRDLAYVSPRTGRAVSALAAKPWADRLLALPAFLIDPEGSTDEQAIAAGLVLTSHFLRRHVYADRKAGLPSARLRLQALFGSAAGTTTRSSDGLSPGEAVVQETDGR